MRFLSALLVLLVGTSCVMISWSFIDDVRVEAWDELVDLKHHDATAAMVEIIAHDAPEATVSGVSEGEVKTVHDDDTTYDTCTLEFSESEDDSIYGWVQCYGAENKDEIITFGKEA